MRKARLLSTVAATLLLTVGVASAQDMKKGEAPAPAQQTAPAEKVAPAMKAGEKKAGAQKAPETTGQAPKASDADKSRATDKGSMDKGSMDKGAMDKPVDKGAAAKSSSDAKSPSDANGSADVKAKSDNSAASKSTTGQGAAAGSAKLSTEQHAKVTTIFKQNKVEPARLSVAVTVGTRVPTSVHFYPVPVEVITIYPAWRGYDYILVGDQIVIIDPRTHEIVAIIEA
jgi:hypothetical protein